MTRTAPRWLRFTATVVALLPLSTIFIPAVMQTGGPAEEPQYLHQQPLITLLGPFVAAFVTAGATVWVLGTRIWRWVATAAAALLVAGTAFADFGQGQILWDGMDDQGRMTGGMIDSVPGPGFWICLAAAVAMVVIAVLAHPTTSPVPTDDPAPGPGQRL